MRKELVFLLSLVAIALTSCSSDDDMGSKNDRKDIELSIEESAIVSVQNSRAFDMLKFYDENTDDKNFIISPLSAQFALGIACQRGARKHPERTYGGSRSGIIMRT